jgi:hypothetical protein
MIIPVGTKGFSSLFRWQPFCRLRFGPRPMSCFPEMHNICFSTLSTATGADARHEYSYIPLCGGVCSQSKQPAN